MLKKFIVVVSITGGLLGSMLPVTASSAGAAICRGADCNGLDPEQAGCASDATTVRSTVAEASHIEVELRYSSTCHAVWTRITNPFGQTGVAKVIGYYNGEFRRQELKTLAAYGGEVAWTRMLTSTWLTYGCVRRFFEITGWVEWCTAGH